MCGTLEGADTIASENVRQWVASYRAIAEVLLD